MHQFLDGGVGDELAKRSQRSARKRVDQRDLISDCELYEAELWRVCLLPQEFGVEGAAAGLARLSDDCLDPGGVGDDTGSRWHSHSLPPPLATGGILPGMGVPLMDLRGQWKPLHERIIATVGEVIVSGVFILGPNVKAFEAEAAADLGVAHAVGVANGTDALMLALRAHDVGIGDEVICPAYTFYATPESIAAVGATPVFADIDAATFQIDPAGVEAAITERTRAIMAVHLFGHPAPMRELRAIADRKGLLLIEDAAQSYGAKLDGIRCGAIGDIATFSFFPTKNLGGFGDGGLVTTNDAAVAERIRELRFHGSKDKRTFTQIGMNSRLDELQAAILRILLPELAGWNAARRQVAERYAALGLDRFVELPGTAVGAEPIYHLYVVRSVDRDAVQARLKLAGVGAAIYYDTPHHLQPVFLDLGYRVGSLPETERASREGLALPMYPTLSEAEQEIVVDALAASVVSIS